MNSTKTNRSSIYAFPKEKQALNQAQQDRCIASIKKLLIEKNATIIAHYYTDSIIQQLAEETGGFIGDSLEMAKFGNRCDADTLLIAGVRFMGESAKILTPQKRVIMPTLDAECSLDLGCEINEFSAFCDAHPDRTVVVYCNTSAAVKARADWIVTSSIAVDVIEHLDSLGQKIIWAPDRHLGNYIQQKTGADMLLWDGECIVHDEFSAEKIKQAKLLYPDAAVLVHPESPTSVVQLADAVGSTTQLIKAAKSLPHPKMIVATERGIFYKMQQLVPEKELIEALKSDAGAVCRCCSRCPWMGMNDLVSIEKALLAHTSEHDIFVDEDIRIKSLIPLKKMIDFGDMIQVQPKTNL